MRRFFEWWGGRINHIFTGAKRKENVPQKIVTLCCIFWWKAWMLLLWWSIWVMLMKIPWPITGKRVTTKGLDNLKNPVTGEYYFKNLVVLPNHRQYTGVILAMLGFMPRAIFNPEKYFPWQTPNRKILKDPFLIVANLAPLIKVDSDENGLPKDGGALREVLRQLKEKAFIIFIEGTRSFHARDPKITTPSGIVIGYPFWGAGLLIWHARPTVVPVLIKGEKEIWPEGASIGKFLINLFFSRNKLEIIYGKPMDTSWLPHSAKKMGRGELKDIACVICEKVRYEIAALDE